MFLFEKRGKLITRYIGPFEVMEMTREVIYQLNLLMELQAIHEAFHVSNLRKGFDVH